MATLTESTVVYSKDQSGLQTIVGQGSLSNSFTLGSELLDLSGHQMGKIKHVEVKLLDNATYTVVEDYANSQRDNAVVSLALVRLDNHGAAAATTNVSAATLEVRISGLYR